MCQEIQQKPQGEIENLRRLPGRRIEAVEVGGGKWLAASSEWPNLLGEGYTFEDAAIDLFEQVENIGVGHSATTH